MTWKALNYIAGAPGSVWSEDLSKFAYGDATHLNTYADPLAGTMTADQQAWPNAYASFYNQTGNNVAGVYSNLTTAPNWTPGTTWIGLSYYANVGSAVVQNEFDLSGGTTTQTVTWAYNGDGTGSGTPSGGTNASSLITDLGTVFGNHWVRCSFWTQDNNTGNTSLGYLGFKCFNTTSPSVYWGFMLWFSNTDPATIGPPDYLNSTYTTLPSGLIILKPRNRLYVRR